MVIRAERSSLGRDMNMSLIAVMEMLLYVSMVLLQVRAAGLSSPASRHTQGNAQTTAECANDIAGKHLFDRA